MCLKIFLSFFLISFLFINYSVQEQNLTDGNTTLTSVTSATTTNSATNKSAVLSCVGGQINPPDCTKCESNFESVNGKCFEIKNDIKPSGGTGRRIFFIFFACLITVFFILAMVVVFRRLNQQHRRRSSLNPDNNLNSGNFNTNIRNRFNNFIRSINLNNFNKRGRFNLFSISNNNHSSGQYRQAETSRAHLSENPDEALLFDDPYADGGLHNSSANPYKSLTLAVT